MTREELLLDILLQAERQAPQRQAKEIEAAWPTLLKTWAALMNLGPGPSAEIDKEQFEEKIVFMTELYEEIYSAAAAGRPEFADAKKQLS